MKRAGRETGFFFLLGLTFANWISFIFFSNFNRQELNILDNRWHHMCLMGKLLMIHFLVDGVYEKRTHLPNSLKIQSGSVLRIGILSENSVDRVKETAIAHLSQLNIWEVNKGFTFIREMSRGCIAQMGSVISWSVVQFWLHDSVNKTSPSTCTSAGIYSLSKITLKYSLLKNDTHENHLAREDETRGTREEISSSLPARAWHSLSPRLRSPASWQTLQDL